MNKKLLISFALSALSALSAYAEKSSLIIGSKRFPESYILAEIAAQLAEQTHEAKVIKKFGLGGTAVVYTALENGAIDLYPEYAGTILEAILKTNAKLTIAEMNAELAKKGLGIMAPLGFDNSYALAVAGEKAETLGIAAISDLAKHPELKLGLSHEFLNRKDGFSGLKKYYGFPALNVSGLDHGLAYEAIAGGKIDATDIYTTDGKLKKFNLRVLKDDLGFFPSYYGVYLYRLEIKNKFPKIFAQLESLSGTINQQTMIDLNAQAELQNREFNAIAADFLNDLGFAVASASNTRRGVVKKIIRLTKQHVFLVLFSLLAAILLGVPMGIAAHHWKILGQASVALAGLIQTIPSLALLCFLIPLLGIGVPSAILALFLYSLLPIVRSTLSGLDNIEPRLKESACALGLSGLERLCLIEIPLASRAILAGIKTSAVINVGNATLAALIGAGGLGEPIITGLSLNHIPTILSGALPAAGLALLVHVLFELLDKILIPKGLRLKTR
ncbi:MAG: ABC transporter permease subunit [Elusimicrobia bacterium]|nr:ABC transporter permease subunit [Elusimicrobiota bacterium]